MHGGTLGVLMCFGEECLVLSDEAVEQIRVGNEVPVLFLVAARAGQLVALVAAQDEAQQGVVTGVGGLTLGELP